MTNPYDIENPPTGAEWLALSEDDRIGLVRDLHERTRSPAGSSPLSHAAIHVVVENRLAEGHAAVVAAYDRCRAAGLDRHAAIHALGSVVTKHMIGALEAKGGFDPDVANADYAKLDPAAFRPKKSGTGLSKGLWKPRRR